jgi:hypothetical protein
LPPAREPTGASFGRIGGLSGPMIGGFVPGVPGLRDAVFLVLGGIIAAAGSAMIILGRVTRNDAVEVS